MQHLVAFSTLSPKQKAIIIVAKCSKGFNSISTIQCSLSHGLADDINDIFPSASPKTFRLSTTIPQLPFTTRQLTTSTPNPYAMSSARFVLRSSRALRTFSTSKTRAFSSAIPRFASERDRGNPNENKTPSTDLNALNKRGNDTTEKYRKRQQEKSLNPHLTNTTSTIANEMPTVGKDAPPPELLSATDPKFEPKDSVKENTERMTGGTQGQSAQKNNQGIEASTTEQEHGVPGADGEIGVGEMEGAKFKVEPLRRTGEDANTMRARLLCNDASQALNPLPNIP